MEYAYGISPKDSNSMIVEGQSFSIHQFHFDLHVFVDHGV